MVKKYYKLFRVKDNVLYPLYVNSSQAVQIGVILKAQESQKDKNGRVRSKLGSLKYRPGWHLCELPLADHIGKRQPNGKLYQARDSVWCEVEIPDYLPDHTEYLQTVSNNYKDRCFDHIVPGYYWYKTNPSAKVKWLISSEIKVIRMLTPSEVETLCKNAGLKAQPIDGTYKYYDYDPDQLALIDKFVKNAEHFGCKVVTGRTFEEFGRHNGFKGVHSMDDIARLFSDENDPYLYNFAYLPIDEVQKPGQKDGFGWELQKGTTYWILPETDGTPYAVEDPWFPAVKDFPKIQEVKSRRW